MYSIKHVFALPLLFALAAFLLLPLDSAMAQQEDTITGTIIETMNASDYTYMKVKTDKETVWVAIPATPVAKGDEVTFAAGMVMENFHSKTLDRNFDRILFSTGLASENATVTEMGATSSGTPSSSFDAAVQNETQPTAVQPLAPESGGSAGATVPFMNIEIKKASGENGYTVAEIFNKADELDGKKVRVRGKVVKVSRNIMGKNWIHIQDGTGDPMHNSHDLVITSQDLAKRDSVIVAEGTLAADKDFGYGYKYDAIIEDAVLSE